MSLPRYALPEDDDDSTAPAEFLLKLPPSYALKLAALAPATPGEWMLPAPVVMPASSASKSAGLRSPRIIAAIAGAAVAMAIIVGVGGALAKSSGGPVGISKHAPKKMDHAARVPTRQTGVHVAHAQASTTHARPHGKHKR
jgi:hypothetical protein